MSVQTVPFTTLKSHPGRQIPGALSGAFVDTAAKLNTQKDVEKRLQALAAKDRIRIREFFLDFDKLRKGYCGEAAFRTCIGTLNVRLEESEIQELMKKYAHESQVGLIRYADFCDNLNTVFSDAADPQAVVEEAKSTPLMSAAESEALAAYMTTLNHEIVSKRILLKPGFHDFDRSKSQHVTSHQFLRVLKTLTLMPPNADIFSLITRKYCDLGNTQEINYWKFCNDVDRPEAIYPPYVPKKPVKEWVYDHGVHRVQTSTFFNQPTEDLDVVNNRFMQAKVDISNDPADVEDRIRSIVVMKRVRIEEFFIDFDKLRKGRVTRNQFKGILSSMNFSLTDDEFNSLADKYKTNDPECFFNYVDFVHSINQAFTTKGIDKAPEVRVKALTQDDTFLARRKYLGAEDADMQAILDNFRAAIKTQRMHLKPVFQDFDITKNGHVTKHQFLRVLNNLRMELPDVLVQKLLRKYMDKGNVDEVNYVDFCEDVDGSDQLYGAGRDFNHSHAYFPKTTARVTGTTIVDNNPDDLHDVVARIRTVTKEQRIRLGEFFRDFDKLRSGHISAAQFRIGLNMAKLSISQKEFALLCEAFKAPKAGDHVCWCQFCDSVDEVFTKKGLEKNLDCVLGDARTSTVYGRAAASQLDQSSVQSILDGFTEVIRKQRLDAKSFFQDWDRHKHFKVSGKQFQQTLTLLGYPLTAEQIALVKTVYGTDNDEVCYADFLKDANCLEYVIHGPTTELKSTYVKKWTDFTGDHSNHDALMLKIKNQCKKDRIRLLEFFQDHDILRKGYVPNQKFMNVLHIQKILLTENEFQHLQDYYQVPGDKFMVDYVSFNNEIEDIFTEKDLEKNPTKTLTAFNAPSILDPKNVLTDEEEKVLHNCLCRIAEAVRLRRLLIKPFFQDKDKSRSGFISRTRFESIFDNQKLLCTPQEFDLINKRFQARAAQEINYVEFDYVLRQYSGDNKPF